MPDISLLPNGDKRLRQGLPWVYSNEIKMDQAARQIAPGSIVRLCRADSSPAAIGYFNPHSLIAFRVLSRDMGQKIDRDFFAHRVRQAMRRRQEIFSQPYYRLIHGEADGLPGIIIDQHGDCVMLQSSTAGGDNIMPMLIEAVMAVLEPRRVIVKSDGQGRGAEKLAPRIEIIKGDDQPVRILENGLQFEANPVGGQKTGWFYDQRDNRAAAAALASGKKILDGYCYLGGFGLTAAAAGAAAVTLVDRSAEALELASLSAGRNAIAGKCHFTRAEMFDYLEQSDAVFDMMLLDPPAFIKSRKDIGVGSKGYAKLIKLALPRLAPDGLLMLGSCSHHIDAASLLAICGEQCAKAGRPAQLLRQAGAGMDHPILPNLPEGAYLKSLLLRVG